MNSHPDCKECMERRIRDLEKEVASLREENEWLRDEEGKRNAEKNSLVAQLAEQRAVNTPSGIPAGKKCPGCGIVDSAYHTWRNPVTGVSLCQSCSEIWRGDCGENAAVEMSRKLLGMYEDKTR